MAELEAIRAAARRVAASHGLDLVDVEWSGRGKERVLRVTLEQNAEGRTRLKAQIAAGDPELPSGFSEGRISVEQLSGITHENCTEFSRDFGVLLDVEELIPGAEYVLEASSPGLDRKLSRAEEFERFTGSLVKVQTFEPVKNNRHWQGRLVGVVSTVPKSEGPGAPGQESVVSQVSEARPGAPNVMGEPAITIDLSAVRQNSKSRKAGVSTVEIALSNIEKAQLIPEI